VTPSDMLFMPMPFYENRSFNVFHINDNDWKSERRHTFLWEDYDWRNGRKWSWTILKHYLCVCLGGLRDNIDDLRQDSRPLDLSNTKRVLTSQPQLSMAGVDSSITGFQRTSTVQVFVVVTPWTCCSTLFESMTSYWLPWVSPDGCWDSRPSAFFQILT